MFRTNDLKALTAEATEACAQMGIEQDTLQPKQIDSFQTAQKEPAELAQVRLQHYQQRRKSKCVVTNC